MGKRVRIDFVVRELDAEGGAEQAKGVSFGDEVDAADIADFFDRARDGTDIIFNGKRKKRSNAAREVADEFAKLVSEQAKLVCQAKAQSTMPCTPQSHIEGDIDAFSAMKKMARSPG
jgi:hypothetical protein